MNRLESLMVLNQKLRNLGIPDEEIADALIKHYDRQKDRQVYSPKSIFESLKNGESIAFFDHKDWDSYCEVSATVYKRDITDEIRVIHSFYDCTGKFFTTHIRQFYNKHLGMWIILNYLTRDV